MCASLPQPTLRKISAYWRNLHCNNEEEQGGEKEIVFGAVGSAQEAALQSHLSKALSRCKM